MGAGTFKPLSAGPIESHHMHAESCVLTCSTLQLIRSQNRRIATGTTTLRTLESVYWMAVYHKTNGTFPDILPQWTPYELDDFNMSYEDALDYLIELIPNEGLWTFKTRIMIKPGYRIRSISGLITNFHQPNSTLLCLVAACLESAGFSRVGVSFMMLRLKEQYRFLSYGDGCLIELK